MDQLLQLAAPVLVMIPQASEALIALQHLVQALVAHDRFGLYLPEH